MQKTLFYAIFNLSRFITIQIKSLIIYKQFNNDKTKKILK